MDQEDIEHFKTIAGASPKLLTDSQRKTNKATSHSRLDQAYCLQKAKAIASCYRRDEAQNPEGFAAALSVLLSDYPKSVVDYAADPRTGVAKEFPKGLPNIGQIGELLDTLAKRIETIAKLEKDNRVAKPFVPPPLKPGQINSIMFHKLVAEGKTLSRPVGPFETVDDQWNRDLKLGAQAKVAEAQGFIEANQKWFNRECASAGLNPSFETISPALKAQLKRREEESGLS